MQASRTFAYVRVSTVGQTTENQIHEIEGAGFKVDRRRVVSETVSGSSAIAQRPGFQQLLNRLSRTTSSSSPSWIAWDAMPSTSPARSPSWPNSASVFIASLLAAST
jgi:hypothetical protein